MPSHYDTLGVPPDASPVAIREAYLRLAKAHHPDRRQQEDVDRAEYAEAVMKRANAAWWVLRDPERRAAYDAGLSGRAAAPGATSAGAPGAPRSTATDGWSGSASTAASGMVVPAAHAPFVRFLPVLVIATVLIAILVLSAIESAEDASPPSGPQPTEPRFEVGSCVLVARLATGPSPVPVACGTGGSRAVVSVVATPRPCPPDTVALPLSDNRTTLCLGS